MVDCLRDLCPKELTYQSLNGYFVCAVSRSENIAGISARVTSLQKRYDLLNCYVDGGTFKHASAAVEVKYSVLSTCRLLENELNTALKGAPYPAWRVAVNEVDKFFCVSIDHSFADSYTFSYILKFLGGSVETSSSDTPIEIGPSVSHLCDHIRRTHSAPEQKQKYSKMILCKQTMKIFTHDIDETGVLLESILSLNGVDKLSTKCKSQGVSINSYLCATAALAFKSVFLSKNDDVVTSHAIDVRQDCFPDVERNKQPLGCYVGYGPVVRLHGRVSEVWEWSRECSSQIEEQRRRGSIFPKLSKPKGKPVTFSRLDRLLGSVLVSLSSLSDLFKYILVFLAPSVLPRRLCFYIGGRATHIAMSNWGRLPDLQDYIYFRGKNAGAFINMGVCTTHTGMYISVGFSKIILDVADVKCFKDKFLSLISI